MKKSKLLKGYDNICNNTHCTEKKNKNWSGIISKGLSENVQNESSIKEDSRKQWILIVLQTSEIRVI